MSDFLDLQNGWYNGFLQGMGQSEDTFQILQPAPPIVQNSVANSTLWNYFNNLPPDSLTQNYISSGGNQFYSNYRGLMSALVPTRVVDVKNDIGAANFKQWQTYVSNKTTPPTVNQLPSLFRSWAMMNAPSVANIGASDYAAILLDPVASAQTELTLIYTDDQGQAKPFDWQTSYDNMKQALASSPNRSFSFASSTMNSNVKKTWTKGSNSGFFGLWGGSSSTSTVSTKFSSSSVTVNASFTNVLTFVDVAGNWYSSAAMGLAFANKTGNPWSPNSSINWGNTFGPNGNMQRFMANIIVASGMKVTVTSDAVYSTSDQTDITKNEHAGFWPFYSGSDGSSSVNKAHFDKKGRMTITMNSAAGIPVVLGGNVLDASQFTGHSSEAAQAMVRTLEVAEAY